MVITSACGLGKNRIWLLITNSAYSPIDVSWCNAHTLVISMDKYCVLSSAIATRSISIHVWPWYTNNTHTIKIICCTKTSAYICALNPNAISCYTIAFWFIINWQRSKSTYSTNTAVVISIWNAPAFVSCLNPLSIVCLANTILLVSVWTGAGNTNYAWSIYHHANASALANIFCLDPIAVICFTGALIFV